MKRSLNVFLFVLIAILPLSALVACGGNKYPSNPKDAKEQLANEGYEVALNISNLEYLTRELGLRDGDLVGYLFARKGSPIFDPEMGIQIGYDLQEGVEIYYFKNMITANLVWDFEFFQQLRKEAKENNNLTVQKSRAMIIVEEKSDSDSTEK